MTWIWIQSQAYFLFRLNCFTSVYFLSRALLSDQKVTSFVVTVVWCIKCDVLHSCIGVLLTDRVLHSCVCVLLTDHVLHSCVGVLLTDHVTDSVEQIPYFGADFRSAGQKISCLAWNKKAFYCQQVPTVVTFAIWVRSTLPHRIIFVRICFNIALKSRLDLSVFLAFSRFHQDVYKYTSHVPIKLQDALTLTRYSTDFSARPFLKPFLYS
jgi:hypothetical protein